jgi:hypothetical protein
LEMRRSDVREAVAMQRFEHPRTDEVAGHTQQRANQRGARLGFGAVVTCVQILDTKLDSWDALRQVILRKR